jgi:putative oxidoreductase
MKNLKKLKDYAPILLRVIFLLYFYTALKVGVYKPAVVEEFSKQLVALKFPAPLFFAYLGTYSVFIAYFLIIIGWKTRLAAIPIIIYFAVAILTYHLPENHSISKTMPATVLLVLGIYFLMNGAGKPSVDEGV